jgi:hypothetical protein
MRRRPAQLQLTPGVSLSENSMQQVAQVLDEFAAQQTQRIDALEKNLEDRLTGLEHQFTELKASLPDSFTPRRELAEVLTPLTARVQALEAWKDTHVEWSHQVQLQLMQQIAATQTQMQTNAEAQKVANEKRTVATQQQISTYGFQLFVLLIVFILGILTQLIFK